MTQIHKKFSDDQVKDLFQRYLQRKIERKYIQEILGIKKRRFFILLRQYRTDPKNFSIQYIRKSKTRSIDPHIEKNIIKELTIDKEAIQSKEIPLKYYNYSYIKDRLETKYNQKVSLPTIINRAKKNDFYLFKKPQKTIHDREVLTNYAGELIQHDSSYHLWSPAAREKWWLITSLDDFSRFILYAVLLKKETSWAHILALQAVILKYGCPFKYYVAIPIRSSALFKAVILYGVIITCSPMRLPLNGSRFSMTAMSKSLMPCLLRPKVKLNAPMAGYKTGLSELASEKM